MLQLPAFYRSDCTDHQTNKRNRVLSFCDATAEQFNAYCKLLQENGFFRREARGGFAAFQRENDAVFLNYYEGTREFQIAMEEDCRYFDFTDQTASATVTPQITQLHLEDFGMSYAIRLSDGRFIIIDGGNNYPEDGDRLLEVLKDGSPYEKPIIAAWIMTHPHEDHFPCFFNVFDRYGEQLNIEKFLYYFPEHDDFTHYPKLAVTNSRGESGFKIVPEFLERVKKSGAEVYTPHTGQIYKLGDAVCEILGSMDDTVHRSDNINAASLIIRMELGGQVILWGADASFGDARLAERYGEYLKADILQIPHHGFGCGDHREQIRAFDLIRPRTCLLPASDFIGFTAFSLFREGTRHLMNAPYVEEILCGEETQILSLPYIPSEQAKAQLQDRYRRGVAANGCTTWVFTGLNTAEKDDLEFTVLNMAYLNTTLKAEIYFEDPARRIYFLKYHAPRWMQSSFCLTEQEGTENPPHSPLTPDKQGLPENAAFSVRFTADQPVIIFHKTHSATYKA